MDDGLDAVYQKVLTIFAEMAGDRAKRLDGSVPAEPAATIVAEALATEYAEETAAHIAHHLTDWNWDAAFFVAVHLFPERFTAEEIRDGVGLFLVHAPNHIREACRLTGQYVWEDFPDDDEGSTA